MKAGKTVAILGTVILTVGGSSLAAAEEVTPNTDFSLEEYSFTLEGDTFTLPMKVSDFTEKGWENSHIVGAEMSGLSVDYEIWEKGGKEVSVTLVNFSQNAVPAEECYIGQITVESTGENLPAFETKAGIALGATAEEVKAAYGEATEEYEVEGGGSQFVYSYQMLQEIEQEEQLRKEAEANGEVYIPTIEFSTDAHGSLSDDSMEYMLDANGTVTEIELTCYVVPDELLVQDMPDAIEEESGTQEPVEENESSLPQELGEDLLNGNIELMGMVYHFPMKISELEANGWLFEYEGNVPGKRTMERVNGYLNNLETGRIYAENISDQAAPLSECLVASLSSEENGNEFVLPGSVKNGMVLTELLAKLETAVPGVSDMQSGDSLSKNGRSVYLGDSTLAVSDESTGYKINFNLEEVNGEICMKSFELTTVF